MAFREITYVSEDEPEVYVHEDVDTGEVLYVYTEPNSPLVEKGIWHPSLNPLFVFADDPEGVVLYMDAHRYIRTDN